MKIGLYPGCSMEGGSKEYRESVYAVAKAFNIELVNVPDWNCCGATAAHNLNKVLSLALPARILALAEQAGLEEIVVPCAACYSRLVMTQHELSLHHELKEEVVDALGMKYEGSSKILNVIQFIEKYILPELEKKVSHPFAKKVACYYGCLLVRPHKVLQFDRYDDPMTMDNVMNKLGADAIDWAFKVECCGAGFSVSNTQAVATLSGKIMDDATHRGAEAVIVACPMCHSNLDMRRPQIDKYLGRKTKIPVIYITQAIGMAIGIDKKELGLQRHFVPVDLILDRKQIVAEENVELTK